VEVGERAQSGEVVHHVGEDKEKLIFVMSPSYKLYVAPKERSRFHHSSFLSGGPALAAGAFQVWRSSLACSPPRLCMHATVYSIRRESDV
jgi:hypothetical protein